MRAVPTITLDTVTNYQVLSATGTGIATTDVTTTSIGATAFAVDADTASGLVAGNATTFLNTTGFGYQADAEL